MTKIAHADPAVIALPESQLISRDVCNSPVTTVNGLTLMAIAYEEPPVKEGKIRRPPLPAAARHVLVCLI